MIKGKEQCLVPEYILRFLEKLYLGIVPEDYGQRMVSRKLLSKMKALYHFYNDKIPSNFGRLLCPEYLIEFIEKLDIIEYTDDSEAYIKEVPEGALKFAFINAFGGMTYRVEVEGLYTLQNSAVTSFTSKDSSDATIENVSVPAEVQALPGYGWGVSDSVFNYVVYDIESKKWFLVQNVAQIIFKGTENWRKSTITTMDRFVLDIEHIYKPTAYGLCTEFEYSRALNSNIGYLCNNNSEQIVINYSEYGNTTLEQFKTNLANNNLILYIELAEPVVTDITSMMPSNFGYIEVRPEGKVIFNNEYEQAVPSMITYLVEVE